MPRPRSNPRLLARALLAALPNSLPLPLPLSWSFSWSLSLSLAGSVSLPLCLLSAPAAARPVDDADTEVAKRLFRKGRDLYAAGKYQEALDLFIKAKVAKPLPAFDFNIARCQDRLGHWTEALAAYDRFASTTSDPEEVKEAQARIPLLRARVRSTPGRAVAEEHYRAAVNRYNNDDYPGAVEEFKLAHRAMPDPLFLFNIGQAYKHAKDVKNAVAAYQSFLQEVPQSPLRGTINKAIAELQGTPPPVAVADTDTPRPGKATGPSAPPPTPAAAIVTNHKPENKGDNKAENKAGANSSERLKPVADLIKANRPGFRACFDAWSKEHPGVAGKVSLSFYLDPDGILNQADAESKGFDAPDVTSCIVSFARTLAYPASPNGKFTRFNYPFDFKPN